MSFADPELSQMTLPVPEDLLEGRQGRDVHVLREGYRSYNRLQAQEERLARKVDAAKAEQEDVPRSWLPPRRTPAPVKVETCRLVVPEPLQVGPCNALSPPHPPR